MKLTYDIGGIEYSSEEINKFAYFFAPYQKFKIKITILERPHLDNKLKIISRHYILKNEDIKLLRTINVHTQNNIYTDGMFIKEQNIYL